MSLQVRTYRFYVYILMSLDVTSITGFRPFFDLQVVVILSINTISIWYLIICNYFYLFVDVGVSI